MNIEGKLVGGAIKAVKPFISGMKLNKKRTGHNLLGILKGVPKDVEIIPCVDAPVTAEWIIPPEYKGEHIILFIHGGAYLTGTCLSSRPVAGLLCGTSRIRVITFEYRLAPENPYPAALDDTVSLWNYLIGKVKPSDIVVVGESAGGGLAFALGLYLKEHNMELPAGIVTLSAWTDLTITLPSHVELEKIDPVLDSDALRIAALKYSAGENLKDPHISPVYGSYEGFCPTLIHVGSKEILLDDSRKIYDKLKEANVNAKLSIYEGMWHVWHGFDITESKIALHEINEFIKELFESREGDQIEPGNK